MRPSASSHSHRAPDPADPVLLTPEGEEIDGNDVSGLLAIRGAVPGMARTIARDFKRYMDT